jgi:hypothetical protein
MSYNAVAASSSVTRSGWTEPPPDAEIEAVPKRAHARPYNAMLSPRPKASTHELSDPKTLIADPLTSAECSSPAAP